MFKNFLLFFIFIDTIYANIVSDIRLSTNNNTTQRIVIDNNSKIEYNAFLLKNPNRLVIDLSQTDSNSIKAPSFASNQIIYTIRVGKFSNNDSRIVFDLNINPVELKHFYLAPSDDNKKHRIVLDLKFKQQEQQDLIGEVSDDKRDLIGEIIDRIDDTPKQKTATKEKPATKEVVENKKTIIKQPKTIPNNKKPVIVIDAGHGGKDPGASGSMGTKEKILTLIYAKALKKTLDETGLYTTYLTRSTDVYVELMDRVGFARKHRGDLFISIHADSTTNKTARGLSIYTLSQTASDTRTAKLAQKENKADIIGGANLYGNYQDTINILVDLSRIRAMNNSKKFAGYLEQELKNKSVKSLSKNMRKFANFAVLTGADTPSILLEIGFISNREEERLIRNSIYRDKIITSLENAIKRYFKK
ncbi:MAG: hypothetical protein Ta2D_08560 [Rickettsiales bacterium]|nr:MAG: hypothetical protein Ta2D_08560 [Rickettsiales bacterium]